MYKKSLFLGAAAIVALLVLFAFVGCSNPSSGDTTYQSLPAGDYPYPADTVFTDDFNAFLGLLNDYTEPTNNEVRHIAFTGDATDITENTVIPANKTVYLTGDYTTTPIVPNITVREGAILVLVTPFIAGDSSTGLLRVRGEVVVFKSLQVTNDALDVRDYTDENDILSGRNTVIGKNVTVLPGAVLTLHVSDLIPPDEPPMHNKFTPAQAWAAAGQGHLVIGIDGDLRDPSGITPSTTYDYTVQQLIQGVNPSAGRTYTAASQRTAPELDFPAEIPAGVYIKTNTATSKTVGDGTSLRVNGGLMINGTLGGITEITLGNGGGLYLSQATGDPLPSLEKLTIGAGASVAVTSTATTLKALETLAIKDGGRIAAPGGNVVFTQKTDTTLALTLGKNVAYGVVTAPGTPVDVTLNDHASLVAGTLTITPESSFFLDQGKTLTLEGGTLRLANTIINDTNITDAPVQINGTIVVAAGGTISLPNPVGFTGDITKVTAYGSEGKVVVVRGAGASGTVFLGTTTTAADALVGATGFYQMAVGSELELRPGSLKINSGNVNVAQAATILKTDTLEIAANATLTVATTGSLTLQAEGDAHASLKGAGAVIAHLTSISGGTSGWQVQTSTTGVHTIAITATATASTITADAAAVSLVAMGPGAAITQDGGAANNLTITAGAASTDGVINLSDNGAIILTPAASNAATLTLPANCLIKLGTGVDTEDVTAVANFQAALKHGTTGIAVGASLTGKAPAVGPSVLTQIKGAAATNTIAGPTPATAAPLVIRANMPATGS